MVDRRNKGARSSKEKQEIAQNMGNHPEILSPREVALLMPPSMSMTWIYEHWEELGGIRIGGRELIWRDALFNNLQGKQQVVSQAMFGAGCQPSESMSSSEDHHLRKEASKHNAGIPQILFYEDGDFFRMGQPGKENLFSSIKGLHYIHFLLNHPYKACDPRCVYHLGRSLDFTRVDVPGLDQKARSNYRRRLKELKSILNRPQCYESDVVSEATAEMDWIKAALGESDMREYEAEKARINVQKAIKRALNKIHKRHPALKRYLNTSTIKTGASCFYEPLPGDPVRWVLFRG